MKVVCWVEREVEIEVDDKFLSLTDDEFMGKDEMKLRCDFRNVVEKITGISFGSDPNHESLVAVGYVKDDGYTILLER